MLGQGSRQLQSSPEGPRTELGPTGGDNSENPYRLAKERLCREGNVQTCQFDTSQECNSSLKQYQQTNYHPTVYHVQNAYQTTSVISIVTIIITFLCADSNARMMHT